MVLGVVTTICWISAGNRRLLEDNDVADAFHDAKEGVTSFIDSFWGGSCTSQEQCTEYIATCGDQGKYSTLIYSLPYVNEENIYNTN